MISEWIKSADFDFSKHPDKFDCFLYWDEEIIKARYVDKAFNFNYGICGRMVPSHIMFIGIPDNPEKDITSALSLNEKELFFDLEYWNNLNSLFKVTLHPRGYSVLIEYTGTSEMRICVCVSKKDIQYGIIQFWKEFEKLSQNNQLIKSNMQTGNTTRIVDRCIQEFFLRGTTYVYEGRNSPDREELSNKCNQVFKKRMLSEHPEVKFTSEYMMVDRIWCFKITTKI